MRGSSGATSTGGRDPGRSGGATSTATSAPGRSGASTRRSPGAFRHELDLGATLASFGEDEAGELYLVSRHRQRLPPQRLARTSRRAARGRRATRSRPCRGSARAAAAKRGDRDPREAAADADPLRAGRGDLGQRQPGAGEHVDGLRHRLAHRADLLGVAQAGGVEHVGAGPPRRPGAARSCRRGRGCRGCGSRPARSA